MISTLIRSIAWMLLILMLVSVFPSCADISQSGKNEETSDTPSISDTTDNLYHDGVETKNYNGYKFRVYSRDDKWFNGNICAETQNGEVINDAIFTRNMAVSDRFNIEITETTFTDTAVARATVLANEDAYDMINARCTAALSMAVEGILYEISDLPNIDLSKPYWDDSLTNDIALGPYRYFAVGDLNLTFYDYTSVLLFNKQLIGDYSLENPYELVYKNQWSFDKYNELGSAATNDINGDGKYNANDLYGTIGTPNFVGYTLTLAAPLPLRAKRAA